MTVDELLEAKKYRLAELRKYQSYYGPNTPYPVIVEINDLEQEIHRLLQVSTVRATRAAKKKRKKTGSSGQFWRMSQATFDVVATIGFIGLVFLLGTIILAAYVQTRPGYSKAAAAPANMVDPPPPTLRPTFTPTGQSNGSELPITEAAVVESVNLPPANQVPTEVPTSVPTLTPSSTPEPTMTAVPTDTPVPTEPPPPPPTATPAPPTPTPPPSYPFMVAEQGNRVFQKTTYHVINIYAAVINEGNVPIGGLKIVGDHSPSGLHAESGLSVWDWSVVNCLDCDYVKQGNLKFEPGTFSDGVWNIYLADQSGQQLSPVVPLTYSADPEQWVWDFIIFKKNSE